MLYYSAVETIGAVSPLMPAGGMFVSRLSPTECTPDTEPPGSQLQIT